MISSSPPSVPAATMQLSANQRVLLSSYLLNLREGPDLVQNLMATNVRRMLDMGARNQAEDHLAVLRLFKSARCAASSKVQ